jgi:predicted ATPase
VALQPFTILVGRNGSGKSNFLDALAFLRDAMARGVPEAVKNRGGRDVIRCHSANTQVISIDLTIAFHGHTTDSIYDVEYAIQVELPSIDGPGVRRETCQIHKPNQGVWSGFEVNHGRVKWIGSNPHPLSGTVHEFPRDQLLLSVFNSDDISELNKAFRTMVVYNFNPDAIRRLERPSPGYLLDRDGSNLASVIQTLKDQDPEQLQRAREYLSYIAEDVESFDAVRYGEYETIRFQMKPLAGKPSLEFDAASMSDGTLRALAAIIAGFQVSPQFGHPSMVGIEEPETALHPAATDTLIGALREATEHTQILLASHSPDMLENRDLSPAEVLVVRMKGGQTEIAPVGPAAREIVRRELDTFAGLQRMGHLEPDWRDLDRQAAARPKNGEQ